MTARRLAAGTGSHIKSITGPNNTGETIRTKDGDNDTGWCMNVDRGHTVSVLDVHDGSVTVRKSKD